LAVAGILGLMAWMRREAAPPDAFAKVEAGSPLAAAPSKPVSPLEKPPTAPVEVKPPETAPKQEPPPRIETPPEPAQNHDPAPQPEPPADPFALANKQANPAADQTPPLAKTTPAHSRFGTAVDFVDDPTEAAQLALKEKKLLFVLHVAGNFEESCFT
jgi:hypothetical protein